MTPAQRKQWLEVRRRGIGASDAPNLLGVGFRTAADVYREKIEPSDERVPAAGVLRRGIDLEPIIAQRYEETLQVQLLAAPHSIAHHARPWQLASLDRIRNDAAANPVELKSTAGFGDQWGPAGTDLIPDGYQVQVQHQLGITGSEWADVAALDVIAWEFRVYRIPFNPEFFEFISDIEAKFWTDHVLAKRPPGAEWGEQFADQARSLTVKGKKIELPEAAAELIAQRVELKTIRDEAEAAYKLLGAQIETLLGDAEEGTAADMWKVKRIHVPGGHVEYDREPYSRLDIRPIKTRGNR